VPKPKNRETEVVALPDNDRRQRRRFSAADKERILREADACTERGQLGELLRREGIYSSQLSTWRAQRDQEGLSGLQGKRPGPKPSKDSKDREIERLQRQLAMLEREQRILQGLVDLQVKAHEILGIALPRVEDAEMDALQRRSVSARKGSR
jgi:transposase-like protein